MNRKKLVNLLIILNVLFTGLNIRAQDRGFTVIAVEYGAGQVGFFDSLSGKRLGSVPVGLKPHEIEVSADGKTAYVSNFGLADYDLRIGTPGTSISVIDVRKMKEKYRLSTENLSAGKNIKVSGRGPHGVKLRPLKEKELFVNTEIDGNRMLVYDVKKRRLKRTFELPEGSHNFIFSADGRSLYLFAAANGIYKMDPSDGRILAEMKLETPVRGLKFTVDQEHLIAAGINEAVLLNPETLVIERHFKDLGVGQILYPQPTPDGRYIFLPAPLDSQILVLEISSGNVVKRLKTGKTPIMLTLSPDRRYAYASTDGEGFISRIDLRDLSFGNFAAANGSNGLAASLIHPKIKN